MKTRDPKGRFVKGHHSGRPRFLTDRQAREAVRLYKAGEATRKIASRYGVTHPTIMLVLRQAGVKMRKHGGSRRTISYHRDPIWPGLGWLMYEARSAEELRREPPPGHVRVDIGSPPNGATPAGT